MFTLLRRYEPPAAATLLPRFITLNGHCRFDISPPLRRHAPEAIPPSFTRYQLISPTLRVGSPLRQHVTQCRSIPSHIEPRHRCRSLVIDYYIAVYHYASFASAATYATRSGRAYGGAAIDGHYVAAASYKALKIGYIHGHTMRGYAIRCQALLLPGYG